MNVQRRWFLATAGLILVVAALIRVDGLGVGGLGHTELYVPGLDLPGISHPGARHQVSQTLYSVIMFGETHPPGYYLMMHPWTDAFGISPATLRMPSALFGIASVLVVMLLTWRVYGATLPTCLAGALMALSGYQLFWSQHAKMYGPAAFFALVSTWALLEAHARGGGRSLARVTYALTTLAALSMVHFAWFLLFAQMAWVVIANIRRRAEPALLRVQLLIVAVSTPLLVIAAIQSHRSTYLAVRPSTFVGYLSFGFHISPSHFDTAFYGPNRPGALAAMALLAVVCAVLAVIGSRGPLEEPIDSESEGPPRWVYIAVLAAAGISASLIWWTQASATRPGVILVAALLATLLLERRLSSWWPAVRGWCERWTFGWAAGPKGLLLMSACLPVLLMGLLTPVVALAAPRTLVIFAPLLLILAGGGLAVLLNRSRAWYLLVAVLAASHVASVIHYRAVEHHPRDWAQLATEWRPRISPSDVIFVRPHWGVTSAVFSELSHREYRYVAGEWSPFVESESPPRVWLLAPHDYEQHAPLQEALTGYREAERIDATGISAVLYARQ